jgi:hypothetical protein
MPVLNSLEYLFPIQIYMTHHQLNKSLNDYMYVRTFPHSGTGEQQLGVQWNG